ncbi:MAG TPA: DsbA family oxidoreductase [Micropepsaceae bacterium]|jgi:predicted DsbA family dithiol-disulfide isomerase|nr:DsbA family oxidoreductase [Micropepsaceae bacterium]
MTEPVVELMVFIDVICPWCYVGKRRLEKALALLGADAPIHVTWRPFELNPDMPAEGMERRLYRIRKFGSWERSQQLDAQLTETGTQEGLHFRYDLMARTPNTFNAHRLIWLAGQSGDQGPLVEALMRGYFTEGRDIGDLDVLADVASASGMERSRIKMFLEGQDGGVEVRAYEDAVRRAGISGVPAFIANRRPMAMGAQPPDALASALRDVLALTPVA